MEKSQESGQDQAEHLRRKVLVNDSMSTEVAISSLPPRSEVHKNKAAPKVKWKIKHPLVRLLLVFFILLPIAIFSIYYYVANNQNTPAGVNGYHKGFVEQVEFMNHDDDVSPKNDNSSSEAIAPEVNILETSKAEQIDRNVMKNEPSELNRNDSAEEKNLDSSNQKTEYQVMYHTVSQNETLFSISMKYYQNKSGVKLIQQWNNLKDANIYLGQTLKIPIKK